MINIDGVFNRGQFSISSDNVTAQSWGEGRLLAAGKLYLNEVMASNMDTIED